MDFRAVVRKQAWVGVLGVAIAVGCGCVRPRSPLPPAPKQVTAAVATPIFEVEGQELAAGHIFAVDLGGTHYLLTAHHLFGPEGGWPRQLSSSELATAVTGAEFYGLDASESVTVDLSALALSGEHAEQPGFPAQGDIAVLVGDGPQRSALELRSTKVEVGEHVWLVARVRGSTLKLHHAVVVDHDEKFVHYRLDTARNLAGSSGAPIVDAKGRVVAIHLGGHVGRRGVIFSFGNPSWRFLPMLSDLSPAADPHGD